VIWYCLHKIKYQIGLIEAELRQEDKSLAWRDWVLEWSTMSVKTFLRTRSQNSGKILAELFFMLTTNFLVYRPWNEAAIEAFEITTSLTLLDVSLVEVTIIIVSIIDNLCKRSYVRTSGNGGLKTCFKLKVVCKNYPTRF
jgi:hypothetical protein